MKRILTIILCLSIIISATGCSTTGSAKDQTPETASRQVIVYFPNWKLDEADGRGEVGNIDWEHVTYVNHAFWKVAPADGTTETSFSRRSSGAAARTAFKVVPTDAGADLYDSAPSAINARTARNHFTQYAYYHELYPNVRIMISIGGWSACGYFSEMAYTAEGRASFIESCIELMDKYPWIGGIDIDWEYPGGSNDGERLPEDASDEGCPIWGTKLDDMVNFPLFLKEFREALNEHYGVGVKKLTACASSSTGWTLPNQDWTSAAEYLDYVNIMTYDMAGDWDGVTGHAGHVAGTKNAMAYFINKEVDKTKLNLGSPLYGTAFLMAEDAPILHAQGSVTTFNGIGTPIETPSGIDKEQLTVDFIDRLEAEAITGYTIEYNNDGNPIYGESWDNSDNGRIKGWHMAYDQKNGGAYIFNDDPGSEYYRWFISYENELSLQGKFELIGKYGLAGMIVWETTQDTMDHHMIGFMSEAAHKY